MSDFIPNSFQVPNAYIDHLWHLLTGPEKDVLLYIFRRIYGWHGKTCDAISQKQFINGIVTREGKRLDHGTGLGKKALIDALRGLVEYKLVIIVEPAIQYPPKKRKPAVYGLQLDPAKVDMDGLHKRKGLKFEEDQWRTASAHATKEVARQVEELMFDFGEE